MKKLIIIGFIGLSLNALGMDFGNWEPNGGCTVFTCEPR